MATREIAKLPHRYSDPDADSAVGPAVKAEPRKASKMVARLEILWEQRRTLYRWAAIGLISSTILAFVIPARYTSTTQLMPPDQAGQGIASMLAALGKSGGTTDLGAIGGTLLGLKTSGDLFLGVLRSRTVQDDVINKFDLRKLYGVRRYEDARTRLDDNTDVTADHKSGIITIKVTDHDRNRAAGMGREYVEALNNIVITLNISSAHKERVFLEDRLGQVQQDLESAEKDFSKFASQNTAIDVKEQGKAMIGAAAELQGELIAAETQLQGLRQIYNPNNVRVRSVQARIDEYKRQLQKLEGTAPTNDSNGTESDGEGQGSDLYPTIRQLPILGVTWADYYRRTKVEEAVFETLTKQYELAKVEEARETPSVKVLDTADVPEKRSFPPRLLMMFLGTFLTFALGSLWLLSQARWNELDPQEPGKILATDVLRTVRGSLSRARRRVSASRTEFRPSLWEEKSGSPTRHQAEHDPIPGNEREIE